MRLSRRSAPRIFVLHDGMGLVAKRLEHVPFSDPPRVRIISDNDRYTPHECTADEINIIGRVRWYGRETRGGSIRGANLAQGDALGRAKVGGQERHPAEVADQPGRVEHQQGKTPALELRKGGRGV